MNIKKALEIAGGFLFIIPIALGFIGYSHSQSKHKGESDNIFWMIYRGAEMFWHDDYAGVNWNDRLESDCIIAFSLLNTSSNKDDSKVQIQNDLQEFSKKVLAYPSDKREYLKRACRFYIRYSHEFMIDFVGRLRNDSLYYSPSLMSDSTKKYLDSVSKYSKQDEGIFIGNSIDSLYGKKDTVFKLKEGGESSLRLSATFSDSNIKEIYKQIFKENY